MKIQIHRNVFGFADSLDQDGKVILDLNPGTKRNEENVEAFVHRYNKMPDAADSISMALFCLKRAYYRQTGEELITLTLDNNVRTALEREVGAYDITCIHGINLI